jgi:hypothetical protein
VPNVLLLDCVEVVEKLPGLRRVMPALDKVRDPILLRRNVSLALGNMPLGFFQMTQLHGAIHTAASSKISHCVP